MTTSSVRNGSQMIEWVSSDGFDQVLSFLGPKDLAPTARVCKAWSQFIDETNQWKKQCQIQLGLPPEIDPTDYLPEGSSYKERLQLVFANILDERVYERYIGKVGPVPRIPKEISLKLWNEPDPCDSTKRIGTEYVWMYCPSHIEIDQSDCFLNKIDDPTDPEAPNLIRREEGLEGKAFREIELEAQNTALKVPVTINNLVKLFKRPKTGNPSTYRNMWNPIVEQHGNKRMSAGWMCMRRDVIGNDLPFSRQQALATSRQVVLSELLPRIFFNFTQHVRSPVANVYPDGNNPWTFAHTSTLTRDLEGHDWPSACGGGVSSGLLVSNLPNFLYPEDIGVAVALPAEVQVSL